MGSFRRVETAVFECAVAVRFLAKVEPDAQEC
jgi:hypothetical protein